MSRLRDRPVLLIAAAAVLGVIVVLVVVGLVNRDNGSASETTGTVAAAIDVSDPAVVELQQVMTRLGYYTGPIDGVYSDATTAGVKEMQTALGVEADGVYGPTTAAALEGKAKSVTVQIQTELTTYGYYTGPIDGDYGTATKDAVKALQTDLGVTADGLVGAQTIAAFEQAIADGTLTAGTTTTAATTTETTTTTAATTTESTTTK